MEWSTLSEVNAAYFILERVSSNLGWEIIHEVPAFGDAHHYRLIDHFPVIDNN
ncbi:MAG: hypothetical protein ACI8P3_001459 [Saprospiraceae bacterium]